MNFQTLSKIETPDTYLDIAFRKAKENAAVARSKDIIVTGRKDDKRNQNLRQNLKNEKSRRIEMSRVNLVHDVLGSKLTGIIKGFPILDELPPFYFHLAKCTLEYDELRRSLGAVAWSINRITHFQREYVGRISRAKDISHMNQHRRDFYGRVSSVLKQIKDELKLIEDSRRVMKEYPVIKTSMKTAAIIGFPNVGKTTLLYKLTGSKPEINSYAFTTKGVNIGYIRQGKEKADAVQLLDTPGTLNRFEKMNAIEKQATLAIEYAADCLVYVFDLTEPYPLKDQITLFEKILKIQKPLYVYISKADIIDKDLLAIFSKKVQQILSSEKLGDTPIIHSAPALREQIQQSLLAPAEE